MIYDINIHDIQTCKHINFTPFNNMMHTLMPVTSLFCRSEDWSRRPPNYFTNALIMPLLCPHYAQLSDPAVGDSSTAVQVLPKVPPEEMASSAVMPGIPTGRPTKLPVFAAMLFAWSAVAAEDSLQVGRPLNCQSTRHEWILIKYL
jgi:hypothetical protein